LRPRLIDPGIWQDERFAPLSIEAKLLYFGFITLCDDYGKVKATKAELKMKLYPWGNYDYDRMGKASKELLTVDLIVSYDKDHYFAPSWFDHQGIKFFTKSKIYDVPDSVLKRYPNYREDSADARMRGKHNRRLRRVESSIDKPIEGWTPDTLVEAIELDAELKDNKFKTGLIVALGQHYEEDLSANQIKGYLDVMSRYTDKQCELCIPTVRKKFGKVLPFPDKLEKNLKSMFGEGVSRAMRDDVSTVKYHFSKADIAEVQIFLEGLSEKRRANVMNWTWGYLAEIAGGEDNLPMVINTVYGDMDMKWERVEGIWKHIRNNVKTVKEEEYNAKD
jgi:hypothetical protein